MSVNTVEHIVECYFRMVRRCFIMHDVKVLGGNNRQLDLLAVSLSPREIFHIESSVTHELRWCPTSDEIFKYCDQKFLGVPHERTGTKTDHARGKSYKDAIFKTYESVGIIPNEVQNIFCTWVEPTDANFELKMAEYAESRKISPIRILSFRDVVLPELMKFVERSNYEDEALRTLSLLRQRDIQLSCSRV